MIALTAMGAATAQENTNTAKPSAAADTVNPIHHPSAWTLALPLGEHKTAIVDTLAYNYQRQAIPSMQNDAFVTTGNLGGEGQSLILFQRDKSRDFFFSDALIPWMSTAEKQKFYNVYTPMTTVSYNLGGNRENNQDRLRATFAGNVNRRIGIGAHFDYLYSKGCYNYQAVKDYVYGFSGYYRGDRYEMQAFLNQNSMLNKENGGITDDLYITDPAQLQGGVSKIEAKSIPTNLTAAHTRLHDTQFLLNHAYKIGYWRDEVVNDTLTRQVYIPVVKFIHTFDYRKARHSFVNTAKEDFWENHYFSNSATNDRTSYSSIANTLGMSMVEGFRKWVKFGLSAYATYEIRKFTQTEYDPDALEQAFPVNFEIKPKESQNLLWVGGRLDKASGKHLTYAVDAKFGLLGDVVGDINVNAEVATKFRLLGDTVEIKANGFFRNEEPSYLLKHYVSNHFAWDNAFGKVRTFRAEGELRAPWTDTRIKAGVQNIQNLIYFGKDTLPYQDGGSAQVFSATLEQKLHYGILNWDNSITYQACTKQEILPLPALTLYSNLYLNFRAFRVLTVQFGVDCDYYTRYNGYLYEPATMSFHIQDKNPVGNYPFCNAYLTCKLYKTRFFVLFSHVNQGWFGNNYFSMPGYPLNPRRFQMGLSVDFAN